MCKLQRELNIMCKPCDKIRALELTGTQIFYCIKTCDGGK